MKGTVVLGGVIMRGFRHQRLPPGHRMERAANLVMQPVIHPGACNEKQARESDPTRLLQGDRL